MAYRSFFSYYEKVGKVEIFRVYLCIFGRKKTILVCTTAAESYIYIYIYIESWFQHVPTILRSQKNSQPHPG